MYSFEVDGRLIIFVPLSLIQIYDEQLKLKTGKMAKKRELAYQENLLC